MSDEAKKLKSHTIQLITTLYTQLGESVYAQENLNDRILEMQEQIRTIDERIQKIKAQIESATSIAPGFIKSIKENSDDTNE